MSNFLLDSRYPVDKIVWLKSGEVTLDTWGEFNVNFAHNLGAMLFVKGLWSSDNFNTCYPLGTSKQNVGYISATSKVLTTTSNVNFSGIVEGVSKIKYRLWGVVDDSSSISVNETASQSANHFVLDTRKNLPRLNASFYLDNGKTYTHNLGKIPYCDIWATLNGTEYSILTGDMFGKIYETGELCKITSSSITVATRSSVSQSPLRYYVRIYD